MDKNLSLLQTATATVTVTVLIDKFFQFEKSNFHLQPPNTHTHTYTRTSINIFKCMATAHNKQNLIFIYKHRHIYTHMYPLYPSSLSTPCPSLAKTQFKRLRF